jgi:predicted phage terminase large subunit-like protein
VLNLNQNDWDEAERELCRRFLGEFVKRAWPSVEPDPYVHGWHMDAMAEHLQATATGDITRLLINVPPGTSKSTLTSVFFPAWLWGPFGWPSARIIGASYEQKLATRDNRRNRILVESEWYRRLWPIEMTSDQNEKTGFENRERGWRQSCAVKSMTGKRGDFIIWDDPQSPEQAYSELERETAIRVFSETLPTRLNSPKKSVIIIIMQRLHEKDVSGHILASDLGYEHLMLPMEFEPDRACKTGIGFSDPRKEQGELLFPARFPREVVNRDKKVLGSFATAGQLQQRPAPREGGMFKRSWFEVVNAAPAGGRVVRAWDLAGTALDGKNDPDWTVGLRMIESGGLYYIDSVERDRLSPDGVERMIVNTAVQDGKDVAIRIPQDPAAGGKAWAGAIIRRLAGYNARQERPVGSKEARATPVAAQAEAGNVKLVKGAWNETFFDEVCTFPAASHDDQVDAMSDAFDHLVTTSTYNISGAL